jgi:hypothetical protein
MANARNGMPTQILKKTMEPPPEPESSASGDPINDPAEGEVNGQGGGEPTAPPKPRVRRKKPATTGKVRGRKFQIPDSVFERVQLQAIRRQTNPSAVVTEILDKNLPSMRIAVDE